MRIKVDLDNIEGSIQELKSEADAEHAAMVELHKEADELWDTIKPRFEERDFKKAEGDRLHEAFARMSQRGRRSTYSSSLYA